MEANQVKTEVKNLSLKELTEMVLAQAAIIAELQQAVQPRRNEAVREMTDDDARRVLTGDLKAMKHKDAAAHLGLSYGQIYSCRLEFTFKHIHKEMKEGKIANPWAKA
jgi:hypothetical protein